MVIHALIGWLSEQGKKKLLEQIISMLCFYGMESFFKALDEVETGQPRAVVQPSRVMETQSEKKEPRRTLDISVTQSTPGTPTNASPTKPNKTPTSSAKKGHITEPSTPTKAEIPNTTASTPVEPTNNKWTQQHPLHILNSNVDNTGSVVFTTTSGSRRVFVAPLA